MLFGYQRRRLQICRIAHTSSGGHRGAEATEIAIKRSYIWKTLSQYIRTFVKACIHCLSTTGGKRVPRPFGPAVHGTEPNDCLQFDFLEMAPSKAGYKYILLLRDDFSSYCWLFPFATATAENAADVNIRLGNSFYSSQNAHVGLWDQFQK